MPVSEQWFPHTLAYTHTRFNSPFIGYLPINLIYSSMPLQDRTNEFLSCVESIRNRSSLPPRNTDKQRLLDKQTRADAKSEFTRMASAIGKDISSSTAKLGKLAQCGLPYPLLRVAESLTALLQWQNGKHYSTIGRSRSAYVALALRLLSRSSHLMTVPGTHFRYQARYCKYQQANCDSPGVCETTQGTGQLQVGRREAG